MLKQALQRLVSATAWALHKFSKPEQSACHWAAFDMISKTSKAVDEMLCTSLAKEKANNRN